MTSVNLIQANSAAFPDRPPVNGNGLRATLTDGASDGQVITHTLAAIANRFHMRFMLQPDGASGGQAVIATGFDPGDIETFRIVLDTDTSQLDIELATGQTLTTTLASQLQWHALELGIDTTAGTAELRHNGFVVQTLAGTFTTLASQQFWLGVPLKETHTIGQIDFDEWIIADAVIGPVVVEPTADFAHDPARWLVIYNTADTDSIDWVQRYRDARNVPYANLLGLNLSTSETINATQFANLNTAIEDYLADTSLDAQVMGILFGYRVPGYVDFTGSGPLYAVGDLLHRAGSSSGISTNLNASDALPVRPTIAMLNGDRLTARIDGPDVAAADVLVTRASTQIAADLAPGDDVTLYVDPFAGSSPLFDPIIARMVNWSQHLDRQRLRLPMQLSGPIGSTTSQAFSSINNDGFFWGWATATPPAGFFATPSGQRIVCGQFDVGNATATTARSVTPSNWIETPLDAGYAAAIASSKIYSASAFPYARPFFEALRLGWSLAEAWYVSLPILREGLYLVGDPLLTVNLPREGWEVFGPINTLDDIDFDQPIAALRLQDTSQALAANDGQYLVQRVDAQGRREASVTTVNVNNASGVARMPIVPPIWPREVDWPVCVVAGELVLTLAWEQALSRTRVSAIALRGEVDGASETTLSQLNVKPLTKWVRVIQPMPAISVRFRWQVTSKDGVVWHSPWSKLVKPRALSGVALETVEVS